MSETYDICVIGAGFGGLMVVANLVRGNKGLNIFWTGAPHDPGRGTAYSTRESAHVLNVRADRMGAFADDHLHFFKWLETHSAGQYQSGDYVPRMTFGAYLDTIRMQAETHGKITAVGLTAVNARHAGQWNISLDDGREIAAKHLVIATGNPAITDRGWPKNDIYVSDFWRWRFADNRLPVLDSDDTVLIVGTGLTAIDAAASCRADGFEGQIFAVSPHGRWPATHADPVAPYKDAQNLYEALKQKPTALHYLQTVRTHTEKNEWRMQSNAKGVVCDHVYSVIDSLRPNVVELWQLLPEREKSRFMRHLWSLWNIHRHRIAPEVAETLKNITVIPGRLTETQDDGTVQIRHRGGRGNTPIKADRVINCTGPSYATLTKSNSLLGGLIEQQFVKSGPLGLGVTSSDTPHLHIIGTPLLGERLETTAVPELREQAAAVAAKILAG